MSELEGRVALITGGASGIGLGIARAVAARGGRLALFDIAADTLEQARASFDANVDIKTYVVDVSDRAAVAAAVAQVESDLGHVYALFNNAGVLDSVSPSKMRGETWDFVINVNLHGVYNGLQAVVPNMIRRGDGGYIVNTSSMSGMIGSTSGFAYSASKFAVVGLSEALRGEVAHHNISVSVVCPGQVATPIVQNTRKLRPADAEAHTSRVVGILDAAHESLQEQGTAPDVAGEAIVAGMLAGRLYLYTDDMWAPLIEMRNASVLSDLYAAYPQFDRHDLEGAQS